MMVQITGSAGQVLADRYRLVELLGSGGMGCVWRAEHLTLGTPVAIKLIHLSIVERPGMLGRFLREARAAARLRSVNVVQILDHGVHEGVPYIAMECLEGESLAQRLALAGKLGPAATALVMSGVCCALAGAHRKGIVHRDLKPDNIFLARDEAGTIVKVLDFGVAKLLALELGDGDAVTETALRTEAGALLGTPRYMSPEQIRGGKMLDGRSDLWSLAAITFECLTGRVPFDAEHYGGAVMQICSDPIPRPSSLAEVPPGFDAWFAQASQRDPAMRFQTARELADALADILTPGLSWFEGPESAPVSELTRWSEASRRFRTTPTPPEPQAETVPRSDRESTKKSVAYALWRQSLVVIARGSRVPSDAEWKEYMKFLQRMAGVVGQKHRGLVFSRGGAPEPHRRGDVDALLGPDKGRDRRIAVVTQSTFASGVARALASSHPSYRAFSPAEIDAALAYLEIPSASWSDVRALAAQLDAQVE